MAADIAAVGLIIVTAGASVLERTEPVLLRQVPLPCLLFLFGDDSLQFAELLRRSVHAQNDSIALLVREAELLQKELDTPEFDEFCALLAKALPRIEELRTLAPDELRDAIDLLRHRHYELSRDAQVLEKQMEDAREKSDARGTWTSLGVEAQDEVTRLEDDVRRLVREAIAPPTDGE